MQNIEEKVIEITELLSDYECDHCMKLILVVSIVDLLYLNTNNMYESIGVIDHVKDLVINRYQVEHEEDYEL
jgi:hypothetical protein